MKYVFKCVFSFLRSGVEAKAGREVGNECLNTRLGNTLLCAGYSVKLSLYPAHSREVGGNLEI